jgi:glycosyltransferase involved in cell wall biosynthesis
VNVLHAIHDFLPRHVAGSEIYAFELCRELGSRHHVTVLAAEYDLALPHGHVSWRIVDDVAVVQVVNNWQAASFEETYRSPMMTSRLASVLDAVQPDVVHIHNLLNLSFDLPRLAHARGIPVAATLHDYTLICPSGGQRVHRAEEHICDVIDADRCARCFPDSPVAAQMSLGAIASRTHAPRVVHRLAQGVRRRFPGLVGSAAAVARRAVSSPITAADITHRLAQAREVLDDIDLIVAPSAFLADEYKNFGVDVSKIHVSDNGFVPLAAKGPARRPGPLRIGFVGTIVWHKGVHVLVEAARQLPGDSCEVLIFGDPNVSPDYCSGLIRQASGTPIRFMGPFDRHSVADVYAQFDVLVVPSIWIENSPLVIHEAFMAGVPVVAARIGGIPDLVADGVNGVLYDPTSSRDLASALRGLIEQPHRLDAFRRARPAVKGIDEDARDWEARYGDLIARAKTGARA